MVIDPPVIKRHCFSCTDYVSSNGRICTDYDMRGLWTEMVGDQLKGATADNRKISAERAGTKAEIRIWDVRNTDLSTTTLRHCRWRSCIKSCKCCCSEGRNRNARRWRDIRVFLLYCATCTELNVTFVVPAVKPKNVVFPVKWITNSRDPKIHRCVRKHKSLGQTAPSFN